MIPEAATFTASWGDTVWELRLDRSIPGLYARDLPLGPVLGLEGLAEPGRTEVGALGAAALMQAEARPDGLCARFAPLNWGGLWVTATWRRRDEAAVDLLVEVQARTVGRLSTVEVVALSTLGPLPASGRHRSVQPRDSRSAGLSYDGRETDLDALVTGPPGEPLAPWLAPKSGREGWTYAELAHADDVSRRVHEGTLPFTATRHALFGHDLEKGVVLRARMQGLWLPKAQAMTEVERRLDAFSREGAPLSGV